MVKYLLNFLLIFFMVSSLSFAKNVDTKLQAEYGKDLTHAPYFLRFAFYEKYHRDWKETYYSERKSFLIDYETDLAAEQAKEKAEARDQANKEKERLLEKKETLRREKDRLKDQLAEEKAEKEADAENQKEFNASIRDQRKSLRKMQREITQEKQDSQNNR